MIQYSEGTLAYIDTMFNGLIPCKVTEIKKGTITVRITANRNGYKRGEIFVCNEFRAVPRKQVHYRCGRGFIWGGYEWVSNKL